MKLLTNSLDFRLFQLSLIKTINRCMKATPIHRVINALIEVLTDRPRTASNIMRVSHEKQCEGEAGSGSFFRELPLNLPDSIYIKTLIRWKLNLLGRDLLGAAKASDINISLWPSPHVSKTCRTIRDQYGVGIVLHQ